MTLDFESEEDVELGLPDGPLLNDEQIDPFVTKIGGKPTWLRPTPATEQQLTCTACAAQLYLLLQMDCPLNGRASDVDRVIYVFGCNSRTCTESGQAGVVRVVVQCLEKAEVKRPKASLSAPKALWDDLLASSALESSLSHLDLEETAPAPTQTTGHFSSDYPCGFPATALHIVDELIAIHSKPRNKSTPDLERMMAEADVNGDTWQGEVYEKMSVAGYDKTFKNFHNQVSHYPRQCVRYCPKGRPLLFSSDPIPEIPPCPVCFKPRRFDLQLMPAVLSKLPTNQSQYLEHIPKKQRGQHPLFGDGMEWGTILVYSCGACSSGKMPFWEFEGFAVAQIERDS